MSKLELLTIKIYINQVRLKLKLLLYNIIINIMWNLDITEWFNKDVELSTIQELP